MTDRYLEPRQARRSEPTEFENQLGDSIEAAYAAGTHDLDGLVAHLNDHGPADPDGRPWTPDRFTAVMADLDGKDAS